jgi:ribosomal protein L11 methyltransferase
VIVANIVADIIIRLCDDVKKYMTPDGIFIASGIIDDRRDDVVAAMNAQGIEVIEERTQGGWYALACKARG